MYGKKETQGIAFRKRGMFSNTLPNMCPLTEPAWLCIRNINLDTIERLSTTPTSHYNLQKAVSESSRSVQLEKVMTLSETDAFVSKRR
jgi:hypothetical protein